MKKALLVTYGSYGDLHPFLHLACLLKKSGIEATIATHLHYKEKVLNAEFDYFPIPPAKEDLGDEEEVFKKSTHPINGPKYIIKEAISPFVREAYAEISQRIDSFDIVFTHPLAFAGSIAAEKHGKPWVSIVLQPSYFFSIEDPPVFGLPMSRYINKMPKPLLRGFVNTMQNATKHWVADVFKLREELGLEVPRKNPVFHGHHSPYGIWAMFPQEFAEKQSDWPANTLHLGFPIYDQDGSAELSEKVADFIKRRNPIVFTLGTAVVHKSYGFFEIAKEVVHELEVDAVFLIGDLELPQMWESDRLIFSKYEPYSKIFPKCSLIVHQCGIGTTAQALLSGVPQVLVPHANDQFDNASRVSGIGCGTIVQVGKLNKNKLAIAIKWLLESDQFLSTTRQYAKKIKDGGLLSEMQVVSALNKSVTNF